MTPVNGSERVGLVECVGGLLLHGQGAGVALKRKSPAYPMRVTCRVTRVRGAICVCAGGLNVSAAMR